jgi:phosphoribosylformylglycinamidine synthase
MQLLASATVASKRWVYRQYDHMVRTNTIVLAGMGAGVVRVKGTARALAISVDGNGRYCYLDPRRGAMLAVAEAARNVACAGAHPIGATNCLNFGNPERPEIMWQLVEAIEGIAEACRALDIPITGGNVSLYNETDGRAIYPTPVIGVVGLMEDASCVLSRSFRSEGDAIVLLGEGLGELGASEYLKVVHRTVAGLPPGLDLGRERALITLLNQAASGRLLRSAHDCSDGGLAVALAECAFDSGGIGASIDVPGGSMRDDAVVFGESASRVLVSATEANAATLLQLAAEQGVPAQVVGHTGGARITVAVSGRPVIDCDVELAYNAWATAFERYFAGRAA